LCALVITTITQEFVRGALVRQGATGTDILTAFVGLVARSKRRYGGYIVHVGIVLIFLGFAGEGFKQDEQVLLKPGQETTVGHFTIRHDALRVTSDIQKQMITGHVSVLEDGRPIGSMRPAKWFYANKEEEPTTEVAIRRAIAEDLYIVLAGYDVANQTATYAITINPLVNWIWFGFGVLALGTMIALLPESAVAFATARIPAGAATTSVILIALLVPAPLLAQHVESAQSVPVVPRTAVEREVQRELICMCRGCGRKRVNECPCSQAAQMREEIAGLVRQGKSKDEILQFYVTKYGSQEPLASPIDKGFNRLAWLFPYLLGASGAIAMTLVAVRWSKRETPGVTPQVAPDDPALQARLDDELRDLD
jgi:cytochrome c-type biogenesis protein CcmF